MWLKDRLDELEMSVTDLAEKVDRKPQTITNWIYTLQKVPWRLEDVGEWERLASALHWTILDIIRVAGYQIDIEAHGLSAEELAVQLRYQNLPAWKQAVVRQMTHAAITVMDDVNSPEDLT